MTDDLNMNPASPLEEHEIPQSDKKWISANNYIKNVFRYDEIFTLTFNGSQWFFNDRKLKSCQRTIEIIINDSYVSILSAPGVYPFPYTLYQLFFTRTWFFIKARQNSYGVWEGDEKAFMKKLFTPQSIHDTPFRTPSHEL